MTQLAPPWPAILLKREGRLRPLRWQGLDWSGGARWRRGGLSWWGGALSLVWLMGWRGLLLDRSSLGESLPDLSRIPATLVSVPSVPRTAPSASLASRASQPALLRPQALRRVADAVPVLVPQAGSLPLVPAAAARGEADPGSLGRQEERKLRNSCLPPFLAS